MPATDQPTSRQLSYLRNLAVKTGTTFTPLHTRRQASAEIGHMRRIRGTRTCRL